MHLHAHLYARGALLSLRPGHSQSESAVPRVTEAAYAVAQPHAHAHMHALTHAHWHALAHARLQALPCGMSSSMPHPREAETAEPGRARAGFRQRAATACADAQPCAHVPWHARSHASSHARSCSMPPCMLHARGAGPSWAAHTRVCPESGMGWTRISTLCCSTRTRCDIACTFACTLMQYASMHAACTRGGALQPALVHV